MYSGMTKDTIVSNDTRILVVYNFAEVKKDSIYISLQQKLNVRSVFTFTEYPKNLS
jgi:hypothetical protein